MLIGLYYSLSSPLVVWFSQVAGREMGTDSFAACLDAALSLRVQRLAEEEALSRSARQKSLF